VGRVAGFGEGGEARRDSLVRGGMMGRRGEELGQEE